MTGVYSGGLVYEYSQEASNYGLVEISGNSVTELPDFTALQTAYKGTSDPTGDGGYNATGGASGCPAYDAPNWLVQNDTLPAIPDGAVKYMTQGAGTGPGLSGAGSQNAGGASTGTASAGSGQASQTGSSGSSSSSGSGSSSSSSAAVPMTISGWSAAPFVCGAVVIASTVFGAVLL